MPRVSRPKVVFVGSPVKSIDDLRFYEMPPGLTKTKAVWNERGLTVYIGENGKLYQNTIKGPTSYSQGIYNWTDKLMSALVGLGIITKAMRKEHIERCASMERKNTLFNRASRLLEAQLIAGVVPSPEMVEFINSAMTKDEIKRVMTEVDERRRKGYLD
jgi:hypothetical protein